MTIVDVLKCLNILGFIIGNDFYADLSLKIISLVVIIDEDNVNETYAINI